MPLTSGRMQRSPAKQPQPVDLRAQAKQPVDFLLVSLIGGVDQIGIEHDRGVP